MNYTEEQLKKTLAKMLPEKITCKECIGEEDGNHYCYLVWNHPQCFNHGHNLVVLDTEFLHLCHLVESQQLVAHQYDTFLDELDLLVDLNKRGYVSATWQQRVTALAKVKGIEI